MTLLTLHVPWHVPLFSIRSRESQGFSLDFGQHVSAAGLSWRLRTARRDTWTWEADVPTNTPQSVPNVFFSSLFLTFCLSLSSNYRTMLRIWSLIQTIQTGSKRPGCIAGACLLWFNFTNLISHNCICAQNRNNNAEHTRVIPSILFEQLRAELGNQSLTHTRKLHSVRIKRRW